MPVFKHDAHKGALHHAIQQHSQKSGFYYEPVNPPLWVENVTTAYVI